MAVSTYALVSLADVKSYLGITVSTDDTLIESLIDAVSSAIEKFCDRDFVTRGTLREWHNGMNRKRVAVRNWPIISVHRLSYGAKDAFSVKGSTGTDLRATVGVQDDKVRLSRFDSAGSETATDVAFSSNATISDLVTTIDGTTGWTATLLQNAISLDLHRAGGRDALGKTINFSYPDESDIEYRVYEDRGFVEVIEINTFDRGIDTNALHLPRGFQNVLIEYEAGYATTATVPDDLAQIAIEMVKEIFLPRKRDESLLSENLGDYGYTRATAEAAATALISSDKKLRDRLALWRDRP